MEDKKDMTDEEIIKLADKTKKEKYCDKYNNGNTDYYCRDSICEEKDCPLFFRVDGYYDCCIDSEDYYKNSFLDGFKAAMELVKKRAAEVRKWYEGNNDISYEEGGKDALIDLLEEIER